MERGIKKKSPRKLPPVLEPRNEKEAGLSDVSVIVKRGQSRGESQHEDNIRPSTFIGSPISTTSLSSPSAQLQPTEIKREASPPPDNRAKRILKKLYSFTRQTSMSENDNTNPTESDCQKDDESEKRILTPEEEELDRKAEEFAKAMMKKSTFSRKFNFLGNPTESFAEEQAHEIKRSAVKVFNKDDFAFPQDEKLAADMKMHIATLVGELEVEEKQEITSRDKTKAGGAGGRRNSKVPGRQRRKGRNFKSADVDVVNDGDANNPLNFTSI